ncbi:MAG: hypothetical protein ACI3YH_09060 [Eubacteriales bacterium]
MNEINFLWVDETQYSEALLVQNKFVFIFIVQQIAGKSNRFAENACKFFMKMLYCNKRVISIFILGGDFAMDIVWAIREHCKVKRAYQYV